MFTVLYFFFFAQPTLVISPGHTIGSQMTRRWAI